MSSALLGGEGLFNLSLEGNGMVVLESPVPKQELVEIELNNDTLKIDGNMAIAWSNSLEFTVESVNKSLINSGVSGEGFVNVYKGTGKVLMAPTIGGAVRDGSLPALDYSDTPTSQGIANSLVHSLFSL